MVVKLNWGILDLKRDFKAIALAVEEGVLWSTPSCAVCLQLYTHYILLKYYILLKSWTVLCRYSAGRIIRDWQSEQYFWWPALDKYIALHCYTLHCTPLQVHRPRYRMGCLKSGSGLEQGGIIDQSAICHCLLPSRSDFPSFGQL